MYYGVKRAVQWVNARSEPTALIITGTGDVFAPGGELRAVGHLLRQRMLEGVFRLGVKGLREDELPAIIEPVYLKMGGYAGIHFMSSMPMREPDFPVPSQFHSSRKLQKGDALITEISGAYSGYSGQIHRTFSIGEGPTAEWRDMHDAAVEVFETLAHTIKDGTTTTEAEEAAKIIHQRGYTIYDDLIHGVNQYPPIFQTKTTKRHDSREMVFRENMVIVIQPNLITKDEKMGLQFGETLRVTKTGCESLNDYPREWIICER